MGASVAVVAAIVASACSSVSTDRLTSSPSNAQQMVASSVDSLWQETTTFTEDIGRQAPSRATMALTGASGEVSPSADSASYFLTTRAAPSSSTTKIGSPPSPWPQAQIDGSSLLIYRAGGLPGGRETILSSEATPAKLVPAPPPKPSSEGGAAPQESTRFPSKYLPVAALDPLLVLQLLKLGTIDTQETSVTTREGIRYRHFLDFVSLQQAVNRLSYPTGLLSASIALTEVAELNDFNIVIDVTLLDTGRLYSISFNSPDPSQGSLTIKFGQALQGVPATSTGGPQGTGVVEYPFPEIANETSLAGS